MSREDPILRVRIPDDLRAKLKDVAAEHRRSMTVEIVTRLERTFAEDAERTAEALKAIQESPTIRAERQLIATEARLSLRIEELEARIAAIEAKP